MRCLLSGGPCSMRSESSCMESSAAVAIWIASQSRGVLEVAAQRAVARPASSSSVGGAMEMPARSDVGILGLWWWQAMSGAVLSSGRSIWAGLRVPEGWRERASLVLFLTPGMCTIRNRYRSVFLCKVWPWCLKSSTRADMVTSRWGWGGDFLWVQSWEAGSQVWWWRVPSTIVSTCSYMALSCSTDCQHIWAV